MTLPDELRLCRITPENSGELKALAREYQAVGEPSLDLALEDTRTFFDHVARFELGENLPPDRVRMTQFWLFRGERIVGGSRLRHRLIPVLELDGGNIGYEIRPNERRKGYGKVILRLTLEEARASGLTRVLLTAEPTNAGSIGIIVANGGVFDGTSISPRTSRVMNKYWIEL